MTKIEFIEEAVTEYLDECIVRWRNVRDEARERAEGGDEEAKREHLMGACYVDAFQSVRISLFGALLPEDPPSEDEVEDS